jgi:hypothetical protein
MVASVIITAFSGSTRFGSDYVRTSGEHQLPEGSPRTRLLMSLLAMRFRFWRVLVLACIVVANTLPANAGAAHRWGDLLNLPLRRLVDTPTLAPA